MKKSDAWSMMVRGLRLGMDTRRYVLPRHACEEAPSPVGAGKDGSQANCAEISPVSEE